MVDVCFIFYHTVETFHKTGSEYERLLQDFYYSNYVKHITRTDNFIIRLEEMKI